MTNLVWSKEYELGIDVIDRQHQRIVHYINQVYDAAQNGAETQQLQVVLHNLVDYTFSHFAFEESLLEESAYTDLQAHKLTHENFSQLIDTLKQRFDQGEAVASELASLLQDWLINHIMNEDVAYVQQVKQTLL